MAKTTNLIPAAYVAGTITVSAGVSNLLDLIHAQLDPACPGAGHVTQIVADTGNSAAVYFGAASPIGGALNSTNYAWSLSAGASRYYYASILGANAPVGRIQVYAAATQTLHVEVLA
jgi:hypothetical protein